MTIFDAPSFSVSDPGPRDILGIAAANPARREAAPSPLIVRRCPPSYGPQKTFKCSRPATFKGIPN